MIIPGIDEDVEKFIPNGEESLTKINQGFTTHKTKMVSIDRP